MSEKQTLNKISEEIIGMAAMKAALSVAGVNHLSETLTDNITKKIAGKDTGTIGVKISKDNEGQTVIDIFIVADYGCKIPQLAWDIQSAVKEHVFKIANDKVSAVNIHVQGVVLPKEHGRDNE